MSSELFEVISLTVRYLFSLLGLIIVLRAFFWLLTDHHEKERRLKALPEAGTIGEFVVRIGGSLSAGTVIPIPWEGILGSLRSCDVVIPESGVRNHHLAFSFETGSGMVLHLFSGCEALLDGRMIHCRSAESDSVMVHGSFLQIGASLLQLRLYSGLNPIQPPANSTELQPVLSGVMPSSGTGASFPSLPKAPASALNSGSMQEYAFEKMNGTSSDIVSSPENLHPSFQPPYPVHFDLPDGNSASVPGLPDQPVPDSTSTVSVPVTKPARRRRSEKWEADWSE